MSDFFQILGIVATISVPFVAVTYKSILKIFEKKIDSYWELEGNKKLETLKSDLSRTNSTVTHLLNVHSETNSALHQKKIEAFLTYWKYAIDHRNICAQTENLYSYLSDDEIRNVYKNIIIRNNPIMKNQMDSIRDNNLKASSDSNDIKYEIEKLRPLIGNKLYSIFYVYGLFQMRSTYLLIKNSHINEAQIWKDDESLIKFLKENLSEKEFYYAINQNFYSYQTVLGFLESMMLNEISLFMTGKEAVNNSMEQWKFIQELMDLNPNKTTPNK